MELNIKIIGDKKVEAWLRRCETKLPGLLRRRMETALIWIERAAHRNVDKYFRRRSGGMQQELRALPVEGTGINLRGRVVESKVYGPYHEFGFHGSMTVHPHRRTITEAFGRPIAPRTTFIRGHFRRVNYKGHPYMRPAFKKNRDRIINLFMRTPEALRKA